MSLPDDDRTDIDSDDILREHYASRERMTPQELKQKIQALLDLTAEMKGQLAMDVAQITQLREMNAELLRSLKIANEIITRNLHRFKVQDDFEAAIAKAEAMK